MFSPLYFKINKFVNWYVVILGVSAITGYPWEYKRHSSITDFSKVKVTKKALRKVYKTLAILSLTSFFVFCKTIQSYLKDNADFTICYIFALILSLLTIALINLVVKIHSLTTLLCRTQHFSITFRGTINFNH